MMTMAPQPELELFGPFYSQEHILPFRHSHSQTSAFPATALPLVSPPMLPTATSSDASFVGL